MLEADEEKVSLELAGWELEEMYQALVLKREVSRLVSDIDDYCLLEKIECLIDVEDGDYCKEKAKQYSERLGRIFIEYGRLEQFQYDHGWNDVRGRPTPYFLTEGVYRALRAGFERKLTVEIEYEEHLADNCECAELVELIDVYSMSKGYIEAYCHSRSDTRILRADCILDARLTLITYEIPDGFVPTI